jgi:hypothetical protein
MLIRVLKQNISREMKYVKGGHCIPNNYRQHIRLVHCNSFTVLNLNVVKILIGDFKKKDENWLYKANESKPLRISKNDFNNIIQGKSLHLEYPAAEYNGFDILKQLNKITHIFGYYYCEFNLPLDVAHKGVNIVTLYLEISNDSAKSLKGDLDLTVKDSVGDLKIPVIKKAFDSRNEALKYLNSLEGKKQSRFKFTKTANEVNFG